MSSVMKALGSLMPKPQIPKAAAAAVPVMPDPESPALKVAARKKIEERKGRGRDGTIYTGGSYSNQNLGGTA